MSDFIAAYWTVLVPWSDTPTEWHPSDREGPFSVLSRGAFPNEIEAHAWARDHLQGQPYVLREIRDTIDREPMANWFRSPMVHYTDTTAFIPLPEALWRSCGKCSCDECRGGPGFWDTLAIALNPKTGQTTDHAWTVHYPKLQRYNTDKNVV